MSFREKLQTRPRLVGLIYLITSLAIGYAFIWMPINQANHHAPEINISYKGPGIASICFLIGLLKIIFGQKMAPFIGDRMTERGKTKKQSLILILIILLSIVIALASSSLFESYLRSKGYPVSFGRQRQPPINTPFYR